MCVMVCAFSQYCMTFVQLDPRAEVTEMYSTTNGPNYCYSLHVPADSNYRALIVTDLPTNNTDLSEN